MDILVSSNLERLLLEIEEEIVFRGIPKQFCNKNNIIYKAMMKCFEKSNYSVKGLKIEIIKQDIPISRGLGSSSSCIVAGLMGANYIMGNILAKEEILILAVEIEGHPDNVAPAIFGGMIVAILDDTLPIYDKVNIKAGIKFVAIIPDFKLSTEVARKVLPEEISLSKGIYNIGRESLMVSSLVNGNYKLLKYACKDAIHQEYRSSLINNYHEVYEKSFEIGAFGCFLSGAGPTIVAIIDNRNNDFSYKMEKYLYEIKAYWDVKYLKIDNDGATILEGDINEGELFSN